MDDAATRDAIEAHFAAAGRDEVEASEIYSDDAVLGFPQGGERIRGKANIIANRSAYPAALPSKCVGFAARWASPIPTGESRWPVTVLAKSGGCREKEGRDDAPVHQR